jgi:hypothetical protein
MATQPKYHCTQPELYTVAATGFNSLQEKLPDFSAFKPKYTAVFIAARLLELSTAENLPDEQARYADVQVLEVTLGEKAKAARAQWQKLKRYITDAFPISNQKARLQEAGSDYYQKATADNWDSVKELMHSGSQFITNHLADLTANNNMPANFQSDFETARTEFLNTFTEFLNKTELAVVATQTKIIANNLVYEQLINMMDDGKEIFKEDEAVRKQFVFDEVLALIRLNPSGDDLIFEGPINGTQIVNVLNPDIEQYVLGVTLRIKNTTSGPVIGALFFYAADSATDSWSGLGQQLLPGQEATLTLTPAQFRAFFNVQNQGPNQQSYEIEIVE